MPMWKRKTRYGSGAWDFRTRTEVRDYVIGVVLAALLALIPHTIWPNLNPGYLVGIGFACGWQWHWLLLSLRGRRKGRTVAHG